jgi:hypothetical protein
MKKAKEADAGAAIPTSELERWFATPRTEFDESIAKSPDFLRKWWKEHKDEWPLLAAAARDLLSVSGSEVDVERLFSGCRDEFGIRRHALKADTVRVLTLLRSAYAQEDEIDQKLIEAAMEYDILPFANSILWRPDHIPGKLVDGMNISSLHVYMLIYVQARILLNLLLLRKLPPSLLPPKPMSLRYQPPVQIQWRSRRIEALQACTIADLNALYRQILRIRQSFEKCLFGRFA